MLGFSIICAMISFAVDPATPTLLHVHVHNGEDKSFQNWLPGYYRQGSALAATAVGRTMAIGVKLMRADK